jgi:hypothetical protein
MHMRDYIDASFGSAYDISEEEKEELYFWRKDPIDDELSEKSSTRYKSSTSGRDQQRSEGVKMMDNIVKTKGLYSQSPVTISGGPNNAFSVSLAKDMNVSRFQDKVVSPPEYSRHLQSRDSYSRSGARKVSYGPVDKDNSSSFVDDDNEIDEEMIVSSNMSIKIDRKDSNRGYPVNKSFETNLDKEFIDQFNNNAEINDDFYEGNGERFS